MPAQLLTLLKPRSVGIWIRVSTEMQVKGDSPEHHEQRAHEHAASKNWTVEKTYRLEAVSGKAVLWHPEAQRMIQDVKAGVITGLIVSKFARLVRNTKELMEVSEIFQECRADLVSLDEPINIATSSGRLMLTVMAGLAAWEREEIGARVAASIPIRAKLGKPLGGQAPFGYRWDGKRAVVELKEAPVRKLIYELYIQHKRKKTVARLLNEAGHRTRDGSKWSDTTIGRLLRCPWAKGQRRANYTRSADSKKAWTQKPESEWISVPVEPIVSEELWNKANNILDIQFVRRPARKVAAEHTFTGIIFCGCGKHMYVPSNSPKYTCGKCRNKVRETHMEEFFLEGIRGMFTADKLHALYERAQDEITAKRSQLATLLTGLGTLKSEMKKCYDAYVADNLDQEEFGRIHKPLKERARNSAAKIAELNAEIEVLEGQCSTPSQVAAEIRNITDNWWPTATKEKKRWLAENLIRKITVHRDSISLEFCQLNSAQPEMDINFNCLGLICGMTAMIQLMGSVDRQRLGTTLDSYKQRSLVQKVLVA